MSAIVSAPEKISKGNKVYVTDGKNSQIFKVKSLTGSTNEYKVTPAKTGDKGFDVSPSIKIETNINEEKKYGTVH